MSRPLIGFVAVCFFALAALPAIVQAQDEPLLERRVLAPGVLKTVAPSISPEESFTNYRRLAGINPTPFVPNEAPVNETLASRVQKVIYRHDVFCYEISYKPLRMIRVDVPQPTGKMQEKVIWYMVYRVRNLGPMATVGNELVDSDLGPEILTQRIGDETLPLDTAVNEFVITPQDDVEADALNGRFFPSFVLEGWASTGLGEEYNRKAYLDRVIPAAVTKIQAEEDPAITFYDSVEITTVDLPAEPDTDLNEGVWGVATWEDLDPRIDYASVYVQGLSNAFQVRENADGTRTFHKKTLQLNFWRPGDTLDETRDSIHAGVPLVDSLREQVEITARYELPGPIVVATRFDSVTNRSEQLFVLDGLLNEDLDSRLQIQMQGGEIPGPVVEAFAELGIDVPATIALNETVRNRQWEFSMNVGDEQQNFRLRFVPLYWEKIGKEIRYLDRLDHLWIYR